ncbi:unnamed protein product [Dimorphilus gyrociliatus]|uniref:Uncharacterized protein n=1 Tax=Dimorphilus gyrociliatus TaxID=2664684 RepID=A0A7I8VN55_9ANNE|nr:unnamed protein product [Dimorphilus gyrociliatus]
MDGMSGRPISVASVFDWTDALPRNKVNPPPGRFVYRNRKSMTKGELEILTGLYNNRLEKKKSKCFKNLQSVTNFKEKLINSSKRQEKDINKEQDSTPTAPTGISGPPRTIINIRLPRAHSPPAAPCSSPEITRRSSGEELP